MPDAVETVWQDMEQEAADDRYERDCAAATFAPNAALPERV